MYDIVDSRNLQLSNPSPDLGLNGQSQHTCPAWCSARSLSQVYTGRWAETSRRSISLWGSIETDQGNHFIIGVANHRWAQELPRSNLGPSIVVHICVHMPLLGVGMPSCCLIPSAIIYARNPAAARPFFLYIPTARPQLARWLFRT